MKYISGEFALNLPCSLETCGDWHISGMNWSKLRFHESNGTIYKDYGIEDCSHVPEHKGSYKIANTIRALLDLLIEGNFAVAQGAKNDFICNDKYTEEFFEKVIWLRGSENWSDIDKFMCKEYEIEWLDYKEDNNV
jgi:hypothetical protein